MVYIINKLLKKVTISLVSAIFCKIKYFFSLGDTKFMVSSVYSMTSGKISGRKLKNKALTFNGIV